MIEIRAGLVKGPREDFFRAARRRRPLTPKPHFFSGLAPPVVPAAAGRAVPSPGVFRRLSGTPAASTGDMTRVRAPRKGSGRAGAVRRGTGLVEVLVALSLV